MAAKRLWAVGFGGGRWGCRWWDQADRGSQVGDCGENPPRGKLELELHAWLDPLTSNWHFSRVLSLGGICSPVIWSRCVHILRADNPSWQMRELSATVANARVNFNMGSPVEKFWGFPIPTLVQFSPPQDFCFCFSICHFNECAKFSQTPCGVRLK